jgi:hypothetical protein
MRGTIHYYCDCGTGAEGDCVAGNDSNSGLTAALPRRTIAAAAANFSTLSAYDTVALCKGGAFNTASTFNIGSNRCGTGVACNDLREYSPTTFTGTAKPLINYSGSGNNALFQFASGTGGVRVLNLALNGMGNINRGFFFFSAGHDVTVGNVDMNSFDIALYDEGMQGANSNIKLSGSTITNSSTFGYLGGGINSEISYNYWDGNGSSNSLDHTIYISTHDYPASNVQIVGNYIHGQYGPTCLGAPIVGHGRVDGLLVKDNTVDIAASAATPGCWGIGFNNTLANPLAVYFRNAVFSGNTIINGGNNSLTISSCPGCVIENNIIIQNWASGGSIGINVVESTTRGTDDVSNSNIIRNNTVWFGPNSTGASVGIVVKNEGTGHIVSNNAVYSGQASGTLSCFDYQLALASYAFINNNHCYSTGSYVWDASHGATLSAWQSYATAYGFDSASKVGSNPLFTNAPTDFTPASGSPLIGAGNNTYKSVLDTTRKTRPNPPAIGAIEP